MGGVGAIGVRTGRALVARRHEDRYTLRRTLLISGIVRSVLRSSVLRFGLAVADTDNRRPRGIGAGRIQHVLERNQSTESGA